MLKTGDLQAKGRTSTLKTGELCYNIINVNVLVLVNVKNLPSVMVLHKSVFSLFILLIIRSAVQVDTGYVNNVITAT